MKRIAAAWERFKADAIPGNASELQVRNARRAFYAGAWAFQEIQNKLADARIGLDPEDTVRVERALEEDADALMEVENELREFLAALVEGKE